jgi:hypothetical protein
MKNIRPLIVLIAIVIGITTSAQSQNVGINSTGDTPNSSAMLDVSAANKGLLIPNVSLTGTTDGTTIAAPATSLLVYNTSTVSDVTPGYYYNSGTTTTPVWKQLATASSGWTTAGNSGTVDGTNFIGTTDDVPFNIRVNNEKAGRITSTSGQVFLGYQAGNNNTGYNNTGIGREALFSNTTGTHNTANGMSALYSNTIGFENTAIGISALRSNTEGNFNTATGSNALYSNTTGNENTSIGRWALKSNTTGDYNTANGGFALTSNTEGNNNTAVGNRALHSNTTGNYNTANGRSALSANTTGNNNTATGFRALTSNTIGDYNTANGDSSLYSNTTGNENTATGSSALYSNTTGDYNTANGFRALTSNTTGNENTAIGRQALRENTEGYNNTANGFVSLSLNTTGHNNTATGNRALYANTTGNLNTATGTYALRHNTEGSYNTANGQNGLGLNTTGHNNTASGYRALDANISGSNNTAIGYKSDVGSDDLVNATAIGANAIVNQSNSLVLGNNVNVGIGTSTPQTRLHIAEDGPVGSQTKVLTLSSLSKRPMIQFGENEGGTYGMSIEYNGTDPQNKLVFNSTTGLPVMEIDQGGDILVTGIISGVNDPVSAQDAATKAYVDLNASSSWATTGNSGTVDGTNFIGTIDDIPFNIKVNNLKAGRITSTGEVFLGYQAGNSNTASSNTGIGYHSLYSNTTGNGNTASGRSALHFNTTGDSNTANGSNSLYFNTTGNENTANGSLALSFNTTGNENTANGSYALNSNTTGSYNTAIGYNSDVGSDDLVNATAIGANAIVNQSNSLVLGNNVNVGIGISTPSEMLHVNGNLKVAGIISGVGDPVSAQDAATKAYVDELVSYSVGDFAHGGIVFYVEETGQHGLICAKTDQSLGERWRAGYDIVTRAQGDGIYAGKANTTIIISAQVFADDGFPYAAHKCNILEITEGGTNFGDWYLPSKYELNLMYENKETIEATALANGGNVFSGSSYWSSTEYNKHEAFLHHFNGYLITTPKWEYHAVRAIRAF